MKLSSRIRLSVIILLGLLFVVRPIYLVLNDWEGLKFFDRWYEFFFVAICILVGTVVFLIICFIFDEWSNIAKWIDKFDENDKVK